MPDTRFVSSMPDSKFICWTLMILFRKRRNCRWSIVFVDPSAQGCLWLGRQMNTRPAKISVWTRCYECPYTGFCLRQGRRSTHTSSARTNCGRQQGTSSRWSLAKRYAPRFSRRKGPLQKVFGPLPCLRSTWNSFWAVSRSCWSHFPR